MHIPPKFVMFESGCLKLNVDRGGVWNPTELPTTEVGLPFNTPTKIGTKCNNCFTHSVSLLQSLQPTNEFK